MNCFNNNYLGDCHVYSSRDAKESKLARLLFKDTCTHKNLCIHGTNNMASEATSKSKEVTLLVFWGSENRRLVSEIFSSGTEISVLLNFVVRLMGEMRTREGGNGLGE